MVRLGDILKVRNGFAFKSDLFCDQSCGVPLVRIRDIKSSQTEVNYRGDYRNEFVVNTGDLLIGMDGDFECHKWQGGLALLNQRVCRLQEINPDALPQYIYYSINSKLREIHETTAFVTVKHISSKQIENIQVPLPPLAEQQRIVDILDRAAAIQRLRRAAEEKAHEIIPALFVDMFGDPAMNPKGWPMRKLEEVATVDRGRSRHRPRDDKALYNGAYPFIQTSEVANSGGLITQHTTTYSEFGLAQSKLWPSGTLCVTIAANIAKTGILQFAACFPDSVVAVIPGSGTNNEFLQAWLSFLQPTLEAQAPQLAQKNINLEILRALSVPMPPRSLQDRFADMCQRVRAMQGLKRDGASVAISANQSLTSALFSAT